MIEVLPEEVIRLIAAGEVVERPASIVKELLENSLDASSSHITLEISGSGKGLIRITDNGIGIPSQEMTYALARHATSKIRSAQDLENLSTFGFRGEALPSISQVSKMNLSTRAKEENIGSELLVEGGKILSQKECGRSQGTTIEVRELFFNTPARLKFLKADGTERQHILRSFEEAALAHPLVWFEIKNEGAKSSQSYPSRNERIDRVRDIWGEEFNLENLIPLNFIHPFLKITGWVSKPQFHQATKATQLIYINKRPIFSRSLTHALYEAYRDCLPVGRHPVGLIFLDVDPAQVDFNVHPAKREVRFRSESQIHSALVQEIRLKRSQLSDAPNVFTASHSAPVRHSGESRNLVNDLSLLDSGFRRNDDPEIRDGALFARTNRAPSLISSDTIPLVKQPAKVLGVFQSLYVLVEQEGNLLIVDQHAAAERVLYEKYKKLILEARNIPTQPLLIPLFWNVTLPQVEMIQNQLETFKKLGFSMELFGEKVFRIVEIPAFIPETEMQGVLSEILSSLENQSQISLGVEEKMMHAACRAAIKANDILSKEELSKLLEDLTQCSNPHTCPHGRPTSLTLSRNDLDKKFGRTY